ncbi:DUF1850 domain-containing protein [Pistricoccus aurantiacus]
MIASAIRLPGQALLLLALGILAPYPALAACPAIAELRVIAEDGEPLVRLPMPEGAGWCLAWNHSVEGFTVHDCYRNVKGRMVLERSHLPDFAAGLDHIPGRGRQVSDGRSGYWIEDINEPVPNNRYRLRVGGMRVDHRLVDHDEPRLETLIASQRDNCPGHYPSPQAAPNGISLSELAAHQAVTVGLYPPPSVHATSANSESSL